jgi:NADPH:quinone reductase-like Zn-dependent oxidoreductase
MLAEMERVKLQPVIDSTFEFKDAPAAFQRIASGKHFGKIVVRV